MIQLKAITIAKLIIPEIKWLAPLFTNLSTMGLLEWGIQVLKFLILKQYKKFGKTIHQTSMSRLLSYSARIGWQLNLSLLEDWINPEIWLALSLSTKYFASMAIPTLACLENALTTVPWWFINLNPICSGLG